MKFLVTVSLVLLVSLLAEHNGTTAGAVDKDNGTTAGAVDEGASTNKPDATSAQAADLTSASSVDPTSSGANNANTSEQNTGEPDDDVSASTPKTSTTTAPTEDASTEPPEADAQPANCHQKFHAASFIGGIVLCGGLVAITCFAVHVYRKKQGNRYHQF